MDAISFVLGIKSAHLRSTNLSDLIHTSNPSQPSLDHSSTSSNPDSEECYVILVYVREENETIYKRSIHSAFSQTTSVFHVDGQVVTSSEYSDILAQENILTTARNFLVFQGDIETIASQNSRELSGLVEVISGSAAYADEYDVLKAEMERSAEELSVCMGRRKVVMGEVKMGREMQEECERFDRLKGKLARMKQDFVLKEAYELETQVEKVGGELEERRREEEAVYKEREGARASLKAVKKDYFKLSKLVILKEKEVQERERDVDDLRPVEYESEESLKYISGKKEKGEEGVELGARGLAALVGEVERLKREYEAVLSVISGVRVQERVVLTAAEQDEYLKGKNESESILIGERVSLKSLESRILIQKGVNKRLKEALKTWLKRVETLKEEKVELRLLKEAVKVKVKSCQMDFDREVARVVGVEEEKKRLNQLELELNEKLQFIVARILAANVDIRESERAKRLNDTIETLKRLYPGVMGKLVDLCSPLHRKYDLAISVVLGKSMDAIVVSEEKVAIECIKYMRDQRKGQATFLPLDSLLVVSSQEKYRFVKGLRLAIDVIEFDSVVERAVKYVVGNTLISDSVIRSHQFDVKVVCMDGTVLHKSGMVTGGSVEEHQSHRWEEKEVLDLQVQRDLVVAQVKELVRTRRSLHGVRDELVEVKLKAMKAELVRIEGAMESVEKELKIDCLVGKEYDESVKVLEDLGRRKDELLLKVIETQQACFSKFCLMLKIGAVEEYELVDENEKLESLLSTKGKLKSIISFDENVVKMNQARLDEMKLSVANLTVDLDQLRLTRESLKESKSNLNSVLKDHRDKLEGLKVDLKRKGVALIEAKRLESDKRFDKLNSNLSHLEALLVTLEGEKEALIRKCKLEEIKLVAIQNVDLDDAEAVKSFKFDFKKVSLKDIDYEGEMKAMQAELDTLAPNLRLISKDVRKKGKDINMEFDQARITAREAKEAFNVCKSSRSNLFNEAYQFISSHIDPIYKDLTKSTQFPQGGTAYLSIEDTDEPYLDGIKYHAMPPMKRFREMELLSGGEKTIVALALLFAIHAFKPSPFFILDEVDAALDNANVQRITNYIKKAKKDFQFVVISLKSLFYEQADALVGVYADQHSSKCLSLDLLKYDE